MSTGHAADDVLAELRDRAAIEQLVVRYVEALDTLDADAYASVFADDAEFEVGGNVYRGRAEIRAIVTRLIENRGRQETAARTALYHVISNTSIDIIDEGNARHQSYYQTIRVGPGNEVVIGTMGRYEDMLEKRSGQWLIKSRKAINFSR